MLLNSVIIVLREVLEAALLFSILIALSNHLQLKKSWLYSSLGIGLMGALLYAMNMHYVSEWFDGVGQEVTNALMQLIIYFMLVFYMLTLFYYLDNHKVSKKLLQFIIIIIISLAMTREGVEILLYLFSVARSDQYYLTALVGMTIGACIGISIGLLFYYLLISFKLKNSIYIGLVLLLLVASGMVSQATLLLIQADWLPAQLPLWDASSLLSEQSIMGQLLYALIGYEATPTTIQVVLYLLAYILPLSLIIVLKIQSVRTKSQQTNESGLY